MRGSGSHRVELAKVETLGTARQVEHRKYRHKIYHQDKLAELSKKEKRVLSSDLLIVGAVIAGFLILMFVTF